VGYVLREPWIIPGFSWDMCCENLGSSPDYRGICVARTLDHPRIIVGYVLREPWVIPGLSWDMCCENLGSSPDSRGICVAHLCSFLSCVFVMCLRSAS
jgi:hypothetical protein